MSLQSQINTNTALILQLKNQVNPDIAELQQEVIDLQNDKYDKTGGLISGDVILSNTSISNVSQVNFEENVILRGVRVGIGNLAGEINQGLNTVAVGNSSGRTNQSNNAISIGINSGNTGQNDSSIGIGNLAGENTQGLRSVAIGRVAGRTSQGQSSVAVGSSAGSSNQGQRAVAIGNESGETGQSNNSIAIGERAGRTNLGFESVAIGRNTGNNSQQRTINIGENSGSNSSQEYSISMGIIAGQNNQGANSIAIGRVAGQNNQSANAIAMGFLSGQVNQGESAIALGASSGQTNQGQYAIAIGRRAGQENQDNNSIVMNATGDVLNTNASNAFFVAPVRERSGSHLLQYDTSNNEICYSNTIITDDTILFQSPQVKISDASNNTFIEVNDPNKKILLKAEDITLSLDGINPSITANPNEVLMYIDSSSHHTGLKYDGLSPSPSQFHFNGTNFLSNTAGGNSGNFLRIYVNGVEYKINLLNA